MNEDENNRTVRFFQWVDDEGRYSKNSIYARLIQRQKRIIRNVFNHLFKSRTNDDFKSGSVRKVEKYLLLD